MIWWIWVALLFIILLVLFKAKEVRHKFVLVFIFIIVLFLIFSVTQVYSTHNVDLSTFDGMVYAGKVYFSWLGTAFDNVVKVSSYVIHQDWGFNSTNVK